MQFYLEDLLGAPSIWRLTRRFAANRIGLPPKSWRVGQSVLALS